MRITAQEARKMRTKTFNELMDQAYNKIKQSAPTSHYCTMSRQDDPGWGIGSCYMKDMLLELQKDGFGIWQCSKEDITTIRW